MNRYLININLFIFFLALAGLLSGCLRIKVIDEVAEPPIITEEEKRSLQSLDDLRSTIEINTSSLVTTASAIAADKKALDSIYQMILSIDLMDENVLVDLAQSKAYHEFQVIAQALLDKAKSANIPAIMKDVYVLESDAETEAKKFAENKKARTSIDKIRANGVLLEEAKSKIDNFVKEIEMKKKNVREKIHHAASGYKVHEHEKKAVLLEKIIADVDLASSLEDIENILNHPKFLSLRTEIREIEPDGKKFFEFFEGKKPLAKPIVRQEIKRIISEAIVKKSSIDAYFNQEPPTNQNELDRIARALDGLLGGNELETIAKKRGIENAENTRKSTVMNLIDPPVIPGAPPALGIIRAKVRVNTVNQNIEKIKYTTLSTSRAQLAKALDALNDFYEPNKLAAIREVVKNAGDKNSVQYQPTYQNLLAAFSPYTIEGLKDALRDGNVSRSSDEAAFYKNFLVVMKSRVNIDLFNKIRAKVDLTIMDRIKFLKNYIAEEEPTIKFIDKEFEKLEKILHENTFNKACLDAKKTLDPVLKNTINCVQIAQELREDLKKMDPNKPFADKVIFDAARKKIKLHFYEAFDDMLALAGEKEENVKIKILGKESFEYVLKGETDLKKAIKQFNETYLQPAYAIDIASLPRKFSYSNNTLIELIADVLRTHSLLIGRRKLEYGAVLDEYRDSIFLSMTREEVSEVFNHIKKENPEATLHLVLSPHGYEKVTMPFNVPSDQTLFLSMKEAALGKVVDGTKEGAGLPEFLEAHDRFLDAMGDRETEAAIKDFAKFFNNKAPNHFKTRIEDASKFFGKDVSKDFSLDGQLGGLKELVQKNSGFKALLLLASVEKSDFLKLAILKTNGNSLEERAGPDSSLIKYAVPDNLRGPIFGSFVGDIDVVKHFNNLKNYLKKSLVALKENASVSNKKSPPSTEPFINAFNLVFLCPLNEMSKLKFDGTDDHKIKKAYAMFDVEFKEQFNRLLSVVGIYHPKSGEKREIFKILDGYTDDKGSHPGLGQKIKSGSISTEMGEIENYVNKFLQ